MESFGCKIPSSIGNSVSSNHQTVNSFGFWVHIAVKVHCWNRSCWSSIVVVTVELFSTYCTSFSWIEIEHQSFEIPDSLTSGLLFSFFSID